MSTGFWGGLGDTLLNGVGKAIDGEVQREYQSTGGNIVQQDGEGNIAIAGRPFLSSVATIFSNPRNVLLGGAALVLLLYLAARK